MGDKRDFDLCDYKKEQSWQDFLKEKSGLTKSKNYKINSRASDFAPIYLNLKINLVLLIKGTIFYLVLSRIFT